MNRPRLSLLTAAVIAGLGPHAGRAQIWETDGTGDRLPDAQEVLSRVRSSFPDQPWRVTGQLIGHDRKGEIVRTLNVSLLLDYAASPPRAAIELSDAFGALVGRLHIARPEGRPAEIRLIAGAPPRPVQPFDPNETAGGSDFSWADLTLDFLWWPGGRVTATEMKKSRECYVVDLPAPADGPVARMRLWIDSRESALLQADAFDRDGRVTRRMAVKSLKKLDGRWTVEDLDIERLPERTRTILRVMESRLEPPNGESDTVSPAVTETAP
jgi:hypothetical protein